MNQGQLLRKRLFDKYSANLHLLHDEGLLTHLHLPYDQTFICPICLGPFSVADLDTSRENHLTLEDVPPKSLGGKPTILTCKECNNTAGQQIDVQLFNRMFDIDKRKFIPGTNFHARFSQDGEITQGEVTVQDDGTINIKQSYKHNKKDKLDNFVSGISPSTGNPLMNIEFYPTKFNFKRLEVALLKSAYLQCFEKYGYAFITDPIFDQVRDQIKNPDADLYPTKAWFLGPFKEENEGSHFVSNPALECIMSIFTLKSLTKRTFGVVLPIKDPEVIKVVAAFHASIALEVDQPADFQRFEHPAGYLVNLANIQEVLVFIEKLKAQ